MDDSDISNIVKSTATRHQAPPRLRRNIAKAVREVEPGAATHEMPTRRWEWPRLGAAFACGMLAAGMFAWMVPSSSDTDRLAEEAVADHVRSLMATHLTDVASSDQHTVKPWFSGKLTYSPPVHDLRQDGFPLTGGRMDFLGGHPVAALIYQHRLHTINLFVAPCRGAAFDFRMRSQRGFNVDEWCDGRMQYWAVSDLNADELQSFARILREKDAADDGGPPPRR